MDCCPIAVDFFSVVQSLYNFFSASTSRWQTLKSALQNDNVIKSLSDTRWEAHAAATFAIIKSYNKLLDTLNDISEDDTLKGDAVDLLNKMNKLEFA